MPPDGAVENENDSHLQTASDALYFPYREIYSVSVREAPTPVYVCICNGFTDGQIRSVCQQQQQCRVSDIYKALGRAPKCGKCVPMVKELARLDAAALAFAEPAAA